MDPTERGFNGPNTHNRANAYSQQPHSTSLHIDPKITLRLFEHVQYQIQQLHYLLQMKHYEVQQLKASVSSLMLLHNTELTAPPDYYKDQLEELEQRQNCKIQNLGTQLTSLCRRIKATESQITANSQRLNAHQNTIDNLCIQMQKLTIKPKHQPKKASNKKNNV